MARCEGLAPVSLIFGALAVYVTGCIVTADASAEGFKDLPAHTLHRHLSVARNIPVCILLRSDHDLADKRNISKLEKTVFKVWKTATNMSSWQIGSYIYTNEQSIFMQKPDLFPTLRCFLGQSMFFDYSGHPKRQYMLAWFDKLYLKHLEQRKELSVGDLYNISKSHRLTIIGFPDHSHFQQVEKIAYKVCEESRLQCRAVLVHPHSQHIRTVQSAFAIRALPAVFVMDRLDASESVNQTFYHQDVNLLKILSHVLARESPATHLTLVNFGSEVLQVERRSGYRPYLVGLYASWAEDVGPFLRFLALAAWELPSLGAQLRFGLLDASVQKQVVSRYIQPEFAVSLPCLLVFYLNEEGEIEQRRVEVVHPSPFQVFTALQHASVPVLDRQGHPLVFQPYGAIGSHNESQRTEGPFGTQCSAWSHRDTDNEPWTALWSGGGKSSESAPALRSSEGVPYVSREQWPYLVHNKGELRHEASSLPDGHAHVTLVMYIIADCSSCNNSMPVFSTIHKAVSQLGRDMYLVNCTAERDLCREEGVTGFPTITVYRAPHVESSGCVRAESLQLQTDISRLDYHGTVQVEPILQWFKSVSADVVVHLSIPGSTPGWKQDETVQLTASLVPRKSRFLPLPPWRNWDYYWSPSCFRLVCERLLGMATCFSIHSQQIPASEFSGQSDQDLVVTQLTFLRRDGVEAVLVELGKPLMESVEDSSRDAHFHYFPHAHSYGLSSRQLCEENHWVCSDFLAAFVQDHARLPVSPLSSASFHTRNSPYLQDGLPIVAALVYQDNITEQSEFYQMLQMVGRQMYRQVVVVTVDVEMYPAWVGHFVPLHYYRDRQVGAVKGDLLSYPRFCLFYWSDHRHAAFFPQIDDSSADKAFTATKLMAFIETFLKNPKEHLVPTEQF